MEKLIELLNEYDSWWDYDDYYWPYQYWQDRDAYIYGKYYLVSRDYWFIKWLVENDKIDFEWMSWHWKIISYLTDEKDYKWNDIKEWVVLMLLSISSSPIDDLLLYLK